MARGSQFSQFLVENPATNEIIACVANGGPEDAALALKAADRAQAEWSKSTPRERGDILRRAFELVTANSDRLAAIMTAEMGSRSQKRGAKWPTVLKCSVGSQRKLSALVVTAQPPRMGTPGS